MKNNSQQRGVLVLGMHRSGTSAMTAGLQNVFGVKLSGSNDCMSEDNPKGYFEDFDIVDLNTKLLDFFGVSWDSFGFAEDRDFSDTRLLSLKNDALTILRRNYSDHKLWGLKDPRISILLPFWEDVLKEFGSNYCRVIALRNPLEVAYSQKVRYEKQLLDPAHCRCGSDPRYMLNLWFWYNLYLLKDLPDDNNIVVVFDNILSDPTNEMKRLGRFLEIDPDSNCLREYTQGFLDKQLKHHNINDSEVDEFRREYYYVFELYDRLLKFAEKDQFYKQDARLILKEMPDDKLLSNWASPIYAYYNNAGQRLERLEKAQNYANQVVQENNHLRDELYLVYRSYSWRLTSPLRKITALLRKLRG